MTATATPPRQAASYHQHRERMARRQAAQARSGRDCGPLPPVRDPRRKAAAGRSLRTFAETYQPAVYYMPWSPAHLRAIDRLEQATKSGGLFAFAMPRGDGKSSLTETAALWALGYGYCRYVTIIGATGPRGADLLESIKTELETNERLAADFPEIVHPIASLERIANRAGGQLCDGRPTRIAWTESKIVLPTIPGSKASGAILTACGLNSEGIRGQRHKLADGRAIRPDLAILDDPQTRDSASSSLQTGRREELIAGDVLGMAGPGRKIAAVMPCTVIRAGDLADRLLDRNAHPDWQGERTRMVNAWPTDEKRWARYAEIRAEALRDTGDIAAATAFYAANREAMDAGADVSWPERKERDDLSAIQHAWNLRLKLGDPTFDAEYQNEPPTAADTQAALTADDILGQTNGYKAGAVPAAVQYLTCHIDVHDKILYYAVAAWETDFTGYLIEYGTYPDQHRAFFTLRDARIGMKHKAPGTGREGAILAGLKTLTGTLIAQTWTREDGAALHLDRILIDAGYEANLVAAACREYDHPGLSPSRGVGITAARKPMAEYRKRPGDHVGDHWRIPSVRGTRQVRSIHIDTNHWKSFLQARLGTAPGDRGSLTLYGTAKARDKHRLIAEHLTAEFPTRTEGRGRTLDEWRIRPGAVDNHWLDTVVGCTVAAAMCGAALPGLEGDATADRDRRKSVKLSDLQRQGRTPRP